MKEKLVKWTQAVFAYGMSILLVVAFVVAVAYVIALLFGGRIAIEINAFLTTYLLPVVYVSAIILAFVGLGNMYLRGEETFKLEIGVPKDNQ